MVIGVCCVLYVDTCFALFVLFLFVRAVGFVYIWEFRALAGGHGRQSLSNVPTDFQE